MIWARAPPPLPALVAEQPTQHDLRRNSMAGTQEFTTRLTSLADLGAAFGIEVEAQLDGPEAPPPLDGMAVGPVAVIEPPVHSHSDSADPRARLTLPLAGRSVRLLGGQEGKFPWSPSA